jgi:hypothetical protein
MHNRSAAEAAYRTRQVYNDSMRRWLARLSFSLLIIGAVVAWETYRALSSPGGLPAWRAYLQFALAGVCVVLAMAGVRARHSDDDGG